jgi:hypothetical protein
VVVGRAVMVVGRALVVVGSDWQSASKHSFSERQNLFVPFLKMVDE